MANSTSAFEVHEVSLLMHHCLPYWVQSCSRVSVIYMVYDTYRRMCVCYCVSHHKYIEMVLICRFGFAKWIFTCTCSTGVTHSGLGNCTCLWLAEDLASASDDIAFYWKLFVKSPLVSVTRISVLETQHRGTIETVNNDDGPYIVLSLLWTLYLSKWPTQLKHIYFPMNEHWCSIIYVVRKRISANCKCDIISISWNLSRDTRW